LTGTTPIAIAGGEFGTGDPPINIGHTYLPFPR
jgi:hypothetical protein